MTCESWQASTLVHLVVLMAGAKLGSCPLSQLTAHLPTTGMHSSTHIRVHFTVQVVRGIMMTRPGFEERAKGSANLQEILKWLPSDLFRTCLARVCKHELRCDLQLIGPERMLHCCTHANVSNAAHLPAAAMGCQSLA